MPLFNNIHHIKTYSKTRHKDLTATTAFDNLIQDDRSSHILITRSHSSFLPTSGNFKSSNLKGKPREKRNRSDEDLFLFSSEEDQSSKPKRGRGTNSHRKTKKIGDFQSKVEQKVSLRQSSQELKNKCFLKPCFSTGQSLLKDGDSEVVEKHEELHITTSDMTEEQQLISPNSHQLEISCDVTSLHEQTEVSFRPDDNAICQSVTEQDLLQKEIEIKSDCTVSFKEISLNKQHSEQIQQICGKHEVLPKEGVIDKTERRRICEPQSEEIPPVKIQQYECDAKVTSVHKKPGLCLKTNTASEDKERTSNCNSNSFADFTKSSAPVPVTQGVSKAADNVAQEATAIYQHLNDSDICNTSRNCNKSSDNKRKSPQEHKLQAKTFVDKLSKLFSGKKSLVNEAFSCIAPTAPQASSISVGSSEPRDTSHKSLSVLDITLEPEIKDSINFPHGFPENRPAPSVHFTMSSDDFSVNNDNSQTLPLDNSPHGCSVRDLQRFALPSVLQEHDYFCSLEHDNELKEDHSYSLLSSPGKFMTPGGTVAFPVDSSDQLLQKSGDSITSVGIQPLNVPTNNQSYEETKSSSKQHYSFNLHEDSDMDETSSVLLLSPLPETPVQSPLPHEELTENISTESSPLHPDRSNCNSKNIQKVRPCSRERRRTKKLKDKIVLKQKSPKTHVKHTDLRNSLTLEDLQDKFCETLGDSCLESSKRALTCGKTDPVQDDHVLAMETADETLTEGNTKQLDLQVEEFTSLPMLSPKNSTETFEPFPESNKSDAVTLGNYDNQDPVDLCKTVSKDRTLEGRGTTRNSTKFHNKCIKRAAEQRTRSTANCCDVNTNISQDPRLTKEVEYPALGSRTRPKIHIGHRATEHSSKRTGTSKRQVIRGDDTLFKLRNRATGCAMPDNSEQLKSRIASDHIFKMRGHCDRNEGHVGTVEALSKRTCGRDVLLTDTCVKQQKSSDEVSMLKLDSESTHQNSVRRLLKSPHKSTSKAKAVYNPRQWHDPKKDEVFAGCTKGHLAKAASALESYEFSTCDDSPPVLSRVSSWPKRLQGNDVVKVQVSKEQKPLFTVVHNVKGAHECQEYGETQEFQDDVDYILDGLQCSQPLATRCLSTLSLASKCMVPAFRMHLRAHGILTKILEALHDAPDFASLSLCLSAVLFTMSCDRLAIELDDFSLRLILRLLDSDSRDCGSTSRSSDELERIRLKVFDICVATIHSSKSPHVKIKLSDVTTGYLGLELLLSLTAKQTADWFKESLRSSGGLSHIMNAACHCIDKIVKLCPDALPGNLDLYARSEKCLRVLDNVTYMCTENQSFLVEYRSSMFITALGSLLRACIGDITSEGEVASDQSCRGEKVSRDYPRFHVSTCLLALLRLLLNITHENERGCCVIGQQQKLLFSFLSRVLSSSTTVCTMHQFDLSILGLSLLMNLVENCEANRKQFISLKTRFANNADSADEISALESLGMLFSQSFKAAQLIEEAHDAKIEAAEKRQKLAANSSLGSWSTHHSSADGADQSGQWVESEAGLQWVAKEDEDEEDQFKASPNHLDSQETPSSSQDDTDNYTRDLHTAGQHMEDSIVAAYIAVLIGSIIQHDLELAETVRGTLPEFSFTPLVRMLRKFLGFMNFTNLTGASGSKTFHHILKVLESCQPNPVTSSASL